MPRFPQRSYVADSPPRAQTPPYQGSVLTSALLSPPPSADFTDKQIRKERPEDLDVPAALADFIHQQRTQEHVEDM